MNIKKYVTLGIFTSLSIAFVQGADVRQGLVSYWPLDTTDGLTTPDVTPFGNHLNLVNMDASSFVTGKRGKAASFNGLDQILSRIYTPGEDNGLPIYNARRYTVTLWVNGTGATQGGTGTGDRRLFSEGSDSSNNPLFNIGTDSAAAATRTNVIDMYIRGDNNTAQVSHVKSAGMALDGTWHHLAWVEDNGAGRLYIDGQLDATIFNYTRSTLTMDAVSVGGIQRAAAGSFFEGLIDEVAIWERPLSAAEIQEVMTNGIQTPVPAFAPLIVSQPQGSTNLLIGDAYTLSVQAAGPRPLIYEWRKNNTAIPGATTPTLALTNLQATDSADYTVAVRNSVGTSTSQTATLLVSPPPPPNLTNGMVAYWPLDKVQGSKTPDVVRGYDMNLVNMTAADVVSGKWGKAFQFTPARSTMLERENLPADLLSLYTKNTNFTVSLWVNGPPNQQDKRVFSEGSTTTTTPLFNIGTHNTAADGSVDIYIRDDSNNQGGHRFSTQMAYDGTWHHIAFVQREVGGVMQAALYIDAVLDPVALDPRRPLTANTTSIGAVRRGSAGSPNRSFFFDGMIDDVALWSRALSQDEITKLFKEGTPRPTTVAQPLAITSFKADLPAVAKGDSLTLRWDVSKDATQIDIDQGVGSVLANSVSGVGSAKVTIDTAKTFTLTVTRGAETVKSTATVAAVDGITANWALLDNFDRYDVGAFSSKWWGDLGGNSQIVAVNTNRMLAMQGTGHIALLGLADLTVKEGEQRTLFTRIYVQGDPATAVRSRFGLTDRAPRFVDDTVDAGGIGPAAFISNEAGDLMVGARNGVGGTLEFLPPALATGQTYNIWIDVKNNPIAVGDTFTVWLQKEGDATRTALFTDFVSDRNPNGDPAGAGGAPTLPDLSRVFLVNNEANSVFYDDVYISKSGINATVPRVVGFTGTTTATNVPPTGPLLAYEGFAYADGQNLASQSGGSGFTGVWTTNVVGASMTAGSLTYTDKLGNSLVTSGNKAFFTGVGGTSQAFRDLPAMRGDDNTTTWVSFVGVRQGPTTNVTANPYPRGCNVSLYANATEHLAIGNASGAASNVWSFLPAGSGGNITADTRSMVPFNQLSLIVVRIDHKAGNDDAYLFVNPTLGVEPSVSAADARSLGGFDYSFNRVRPFAGGTDAANSRPYAELVVDEIRVGESYAAVTPFTPGSGLPTPKVAIARSGAEIEVQWSSGTLQSAGAVLGPWSDVTGAAGSSYKLTPSESQRYFRVRQ